MRQDIVAIISRLLREKPRAFWLEAFAQARVPAGPINRLDQLAEDEALRQSGFLYRSDTPRGPIPQVGLGIHFDGASEGSLTPPPALGADTDRVLREWAGCDGRELDQLRAQRII